GTRRKAFHGGAGCAAVRSAVSPRAESLGQGRLDRRWKNFGAITLYPQPDRRFMIVVRRAAIDDDVRDSASRGHQRKRVRWIYRQRRTERNDQIGLHGRLLRALESLWLETLAETDRRRFQEPSAFTERRFAIAPEKLEVASRIAAVFAAHAFDQQVRAVQFHQPLCARA